VEYKDSLCSYIDFVIGDLKEIKEYIQSCSENTSPLNRPSVSVIRNHDKKLDNSTWSSELKEGIYRLECLHHQIFHVAIDRQIILQSDHKTQCPPRLPFYLLYFLCAGGLVYSKKMPYFYISMVVPLCWEIYLWMKRITWSRTSPSNVMDDLKPIISKMYDIMIQHEMNFVTMKRNLKELNDSVLYGSKGVSTNTTMDQVNKSLTALQSELKILF
jgi:hypothetical protein